MPTSPIPILLNQAAVQVVTTGPVVAEGGGFTRAVVQFFLQLVTQINAIIPAVNAAFTITPFLFAAQPTLTAAQAGTLWEVTDFGHIVLWTGTVWQFAPGDLGNGFYVSFGIPPVAAAWHLCDGSTVPYLVVGGASLTTSPNVLPTVANQYFRQ